mmetsp:Transcript_38571/g.110784  ORF Transcript_38571/g.110784 Transcript_38571/m.110784 type:complete len:205 (+) Transcript_38571:532-1146(+)
MPGLRVLPTEVAVRKVLLGLGQRLRRRRLAARRRTKGRVHIVCHLLRLVEGGPVRHAGIHVRVEARPILKDPLHEAMAHLALRRIEAQGPAAAAAQQPWRRHRGQRLLGEARGDGRGHDGCDARGEAHGQRQGADEEGDPVPREEGLAAARSCDARRDDHDVLPLLGLRLLRRGLDRRGAARRHLATVCIRPRCSERAVRVSGF